MDERTIVLLIEALASAWTAIRSHNGEVPCVVLLPAPAPRGRRNVLGHFAPLRWRTRDDGGDLMHEVVVVAEQLKRGAEDVFETLLHEAAHAKNFACGIRDCTASQYHNKKFKVAAEEMGLLVAKVPNYGYAYTRMASGTVARYAIQISNLDSVLVHRRSFLKETVGTMPTGAVTTAMPDKRRWRYLKASCNCGFNIRVAKSTIENTVIRCESCEAPFQLS